MEGRAHTGDLTAADFETRNGAPEPGAVFICRRQRPRRRGGWDGRTHTKDVTLLLVDLGVTKTHSRPHVSDDNPFSEAHFKTMKYRPTFPERFGSIEDARAFCVRFFAWYNGQHRHSGIGMMTPADVHFGRAQIVCEKRADTLGRAYQAHPERFVRAKPIPPQLPTAVWINRPASNTAVAQ